MGDLTVTRDFENGIITISGFPPETAVLLGGVVYAYSTGDGPNDVAFEATSFGDDDLDWPSGVGVVIAQQWSAVYAHAAACNGVKVDVRVATKVEEGAAG